MSRDVLLYGLSQSEGYAYLLNWMQTTPGLHEFPAPDYHRVQLEHWVWSHREALGRDILDVGVYNPRRYLGDGYITFGEAETSTSEDRKGDLLALPFPDAAFDGVVLTEVLEHCTDPKLAVAEVFRVLKPGGLLLVTSPFLWPDHRTEDYQDYWRFTEQGWELLLRAFTNVMITPCDLTPEGQCAYDFLRRFECFGFAQFTKMTTGYLYRSEARMRLLYIGPGASWATADVAAGLRDGLIHHGVEIVDYALDTRIARSQSWLYYNWRQHKKVDPSLVKPNVVDVFLQAGRDAFWVAWWVKTFRGLDAVFLVSGMFVHPDVVMVMKASGLPVFVLFTESPYDMDKELAFAKLVDGCWTNERSAVDAFQTVNPHSGYLPHAWHATRHLPGPQPGDEDHPSHDVVFVGSAFTERVQWLSAIDWTGIDLGLYGSWESLGARHPLRRFVRGKQTDNRVTAALYRRAKVGLNLYRTSMGWGKEAPQITHAESLNPRAYELAACGAFHVSTHRAEVPERFGDLVPTFTSPAEAEDAIRTWLANPAGRAERAAQLPACVAESSWRNRATAVIGDLQTLLQRRAA